MNHHNKKNARKGEEKERRTLSEWLAVRLDFPPDVLMDGMRVELRGRNALTVYGCRKILDYRPDEIRLSMKGSVLSVRGKRLICTSYLAGAVGIDGQVDAITFDDEQTRCTGREAAEL